MIHPKDWMKTPPFARGHVDEADIKAVQDDAVKSHFAESVNGKLLETAVPLVQYIEEHGDTNLKGVSCGFREAVKRAQSQPPSMDGDGRLVSDTPRTDAARGDNSENDFALVPAEEMEKIEREFNAIKLARSRFAESNRLDVWRVAITLANNICVQESERINNEDGSLEAVNALSDCAKRIRGWLEPENSQLEEMLNEAGVKPQPSSMADELAEALRKSVDNCFRCDGEGIVRRLENEVCPQCGKHRELLARYDAQKGQR